MMLDPLSMPQRSAATVVALAAYNNLLVVIPDHVTSPVVVFNASGDGTEIAGVPDVLGKVNVAVPAVACAAIVIVPEDEPVILISVPNVG